MKNLYKVAIGIVAIVLIISSFSGCIFKSNKKTKMITALEGKEISDKIANNWDSNSILTKVNSIGSHTSTGKASKWIYTYYSPRNTTTVKYQNKNITKYGSIDITVTGNNTTTISEDYDVIEDLDDKIKNWTLDSDEAVKIAKQNSTINRYLNEYEDAKDEIGLHLGMIDRFTGQDNPNNDSTTWSIGWLYNAGFDNPVSARIYIDAETGEVLYAEADE